MDIEEKSQNIEEQVEVQEESRESLETKLKTAELTLQKHYDSLLRSTAEAENIRKRAAIDIENAHKYGYEKFAMELIKVVDSLEKGIESLINHDKSASSSKKGIELTYKLLLDALEKFGINAVDPVGELFNPSLHEALTVQESNDIAPNMVLSVIQRGFMIHSRVLRPARVIVSKAATPKNEKS